MKNVARTIDAIDRQLDSLERKFSENHERMQKLGRGTTEYNKIRKESEKIKDEYNTLLNQRWALEDKLYK